MPRADFFQKLGLFVLPSFLTADECRRINEAITASAWMEGTVGGKAGFTVDREYRRAKVVDVPEALHEEVRARLLALREQVAGHYRMELADCQQPQFLGYGPGDFYKPHRDSVPRPDGQARFSTVRRVTAVIFVNEQSAEPREGAFGGGELNLFEMFDDPGGRELGLPVEPVPGLLITFPSTQMHSVAPVTHGERRSIVSWFV